MLSGLRNEQRPPYERATFWADLRAGITLTASFVPTAMALGVMPGSGTIATMTSRRFGGKTVVAGIICLVIIVALILGFGAHVAPIPLAALSAIVVFGVTDRIRIPLFAFGFLDRIPEARIVETQKEARELAWSLVAPSGRA